MVAVVPVSFSPPAVEGCRIFATRSTSFVVKTLALVAALAIFFAAFLSFFFRAVVMA